MSETAEQVAHDLLVEKLQKLLNQKSKLTYDLGIIEQSIPLAVNILRAFEEKHNLPKRMSIY